MIIFYEFPMNQYFVVMGQATRLFNGRHLRSPSFFPTGPPRMKMLRRESEEKGEREKRRKRETSVGVEREERE